MQHNLPAVRAPRPTGLLARLGSLHRQLRDREVYRTVVAYVVAAAGTLSLASSLTDPLHLPSGIINYLVAAAVAGLPLAVTGAWFFDLRRDRTSARPDALAAEPVDAAPARPDGYVDNLHAQPTPFVGRERELAAVADALARPECRLVTITGPGGMGKTRLALEAARRAIGGFSHGVCVVPLAGVRAPELIAPAVATALRLTLSGRDDPRARVLEYLREKRLLLVMDNFEHLTGGAPLVAQGLQAAPGVRVLVTSRERLGLAGEHLVALQGMEIGPPEAEDDADAVRLFLEGARRVRPGFEPTPVERDAIRRICALVEGLPLAIDLASPWVRMLPPREIESEIAASRDFLAATDPAMNPRHRSLRSAFDWSWRHLGDDERRALSRLAVFRGGFDRAAAQAVAAAGLPMLSTLADKSLVRVAGPGRYEILDLLRRYAEAELRRHPEEFADARTLHAAEYAARMRAVVREQREHPGAHALRDRVGDEVRNVRRAAEWAAQHSAADDLETLLLGAYAFWDGQGRALEGEEPFATAVAAIEEIVADGHGAAAADRLLGVAMLRHGALLAQIGRTQEARERLTAGLEHVRAHGDTPEIAFGLQHLASQAFHSGEYETAERLQDEALELWDALGDARGTGRGLTNLGAVAQARGDYARARELYGRAVELLRASGEPALLFAPLCNLGIIASVRHEWAEARRLLGESLEVARQAENPRLVANALQNLGAAAWEVGDYAAAEQHLSEAVRICREMGFRRLLAFCLNALGTVFVARGELGQAADALQQGLATAAVIGEAPLTLEVLLGIARLRHGQARDAEAAELVGLLLAHPATDQEARTSAEEFAAELSSSLHPADFEAASARGRAAELDGVVTRLLHPRAPAAPVAVSA